MSGCGTTDGAGQQARGRERRALTIFVVTVIVLAVGSGIAGGLLVSGLDDGRAGRELDATGWLVLVATLVGAALVVSAVVVAIFWWQRRRGSTLFARPALSELPTRRDRTALLKALRRGDPIAPERRELARRVAKDWLGRRGLIWIYLAMTLLEAVNAALQPDLTRWFAAAAAVLFLLCAGYFWRLIRQMRQALARLDAAAPM